MPNDVFILKLQNKFWYSALLIICKYLISIFSRMDLQDDYLDLYKEGEESGRIFTLLFNSSNLISPAYAAAIVLGISFGIAALAGLLYYALIGGFDSEGSYGGYSQYSSYLNSNVFF